MKSIHAPDQLLQAFKKTLEGHAFVGIKFRLAPHPAKNPKLWVEARNRKTHLSILPDLYPSRKLLHPIQDSASSPFLLLAPHIPEPLALDFRKAGLNHADLNGRLFLRTPDLLLDREPRGKQYRGPIVAADWFSHKSSRLLRTLLSHPGKTWQQKELIQRTGVSPGLVSRLLTAMEQEGFLSKEPGSGKGKSATYDLKESGRLLDLWQAKDVWRRRVQVEEYSVLRGDLEEVAGMVQDELGKDNLAFTQWFAANLRYPYTTPPVVSAYIREERLPEIPFGRRVTAGGNLKLLIPEDEGVFMETQEVKGYRLATDIQIYLDLLQVGQRGPEQAEALRAWNGFNR